MTSLLLVLAIQFRAIPRDSYGVPLIKALSIRQAWEDQGFAAAEDRMWQMELSRHLARGTLASILGHSALASDTEVAKTGYTTAELQAQFDRLSPFAKTAMDGYAAGVTRFIQSQRLPPDFAAAGDDPRPWSVLDSAAICIRLFQEFGRGGAGELRNLAFIQYAKTQPKLKGRYLDALDDFAWQNDPAALTTIAPADDTLAANPPVIFPAFDRATTEARLKEIPVPSLFELLPAVRLAERADSHLLAERLSTPFRTGSYCVVVSSRRSSSGVPLLLSGPQMGFTTPSILHEVSIDAPGLHVAGADVPGVPGVVVGKTDHFAWGVTSGEADTEEIVWSKTAPLGAGVNSSGGGSKTLRGDPSLDGPPQLLRWPVAGEWLVSPWDLSARFNLGFHAQAGYGNTSHSPATTAYNLSPIPLMPYSPQLSDRGAGWDMPVDLSFDVSHRPPLPQRSVRGGAWGIVRTSLRLPLPQRDAPGRGEALAGEGGVGVKSNLQKSILGQRFEATNLILTAATGRRDQGYIHEEKVAPILERTVTIEVKGEPSTTVTSRWTAYGPVVLSSPSLGVVFSRHSAYRGEELRSFDALLSTYQKQTAAEIDHAISPATMNFNYFFATTSGDIGYRYLGLVPLRAAGLDPRLPTPDEKQYAWRGFVPPAQMPHTLNPKAGLIANWNNKPTAWWPNGDTPAWGRIHQANSLLAELDKSKFSADDLANVVENIAETEYRWPLFKEFAPPFEGRLTQGSAEPQFVRWFEKLRRQLVQPVTGGFLSPDVFNIVVQPTVVWNALHGQTHLDFLNGRTATEVADRAKLEDFGQPSPEFGGNGYTPTGPTFKNIGKMPYGNRGTYIQIVELTKPAPRGRSTLPPGEATTGPHAGDQLSLANRWSYKAMH